MFSRGDTMQKKKIGVVLGGGGGKGAYQIGVLRALEEYKIMKKVTHISGTSIGAINMTVYLSGKSKKVQEVWSKINKNVALGKMTLKQVLASRSLFSREGIIKIADDSINFEKVRKSKVEAYAIAAPVGRGRKNAPYAFDVTKKNKDEIMNILLASSAIPFVFEAVEINNVKYVDGFGIDNVPVKLLKEKGCELIFVVPLNETSSAHKYADENTTIIDFFSPYNDYNFITGTLDFKDSRIKMREEHGYYVAKTLLEELIAEGYLELSLTQKVKNKIKRKVFVQSEPERLNYFNLSKSKITQIPSEEYREDSFQNNESQKQFIKRD